MADLWYYAEGEETRGPVTLGELVPLLSRIADPRRVMVWRHGFVDWKAVEEVREVAQELFRPPPIKRTPPVIPVSAPPKIREPVVDAMDASHFKNVKPELTGIGGWLALIAFGQVVGILRFLASMATYYGELDAQFWKLFPVTAWGEVVINVGLISMFAYTTILLFRKSRRFPNFFIWQFIVTILAPFIAIIWVALTMGAKAGDAALNSMTPKDWGQIIASVVGAAIWITYILRSRRVRNTFVEYS